MEKTGRERLYKNVWKLGRNGLVEPASIVFNTSFKYTSSKPYDWSVVTVFFNTYANHLASPGRV